MKAKLLRIIPIVVIVVVGYNVYQKQFSNDAKISRFGTSYGNVEIREVNLGFRVAGRVTEVFVEEGNAVKTGQALAQLDKEPLELKVNVLQANQLAANENLNRLLNGFRSEEIAQATALLNQKYARLENADIEYKRQLALQESHAGTQQNLDNAKSAFADAKASVNVAKANLDLLQAGYRKEDIAKAKAQVASIQAEIDQIKLQLSDTTLRSPSDATVLVRAIEEGTMVGAGQTALSLTLEDRTWVRAYIPQTHLGKIHPGMKVKVYTDSQPETPYHGHIGFIASKAEFTPKNVQTEELRSDLVFRYRVVLDAPDSGLRQGMPVTIRYAPEES